MMKFLKGLPVLVAILLVILLIAIAIGFQGVIVYLVWNYLVLWLIPTLPVLGFTQSCVAGVILSILGSFFRSK